MNEKDGQVLISFLMEDYDKYKRYLEITPPAHVESRSKIAGRMEGLMFAINLIERAIYGDESEDE